jgi:pimeloyl-ACP methyl ester carboxylesterase
LVVLLHGFPEFWYAWRHQIPALADAGYRVVAPNLRGYNTSDKPPRVRDCRPQVLAQDVADLIVAAVPPARRATGGSQRTPSDRFLKGLRRTRQLRRS